MPNLYALVKDNVWGLRFPPPITILASFSSPTHAALTAYNVRFKDQADASIDGSDTFTVGEVEFASGVVTLYVEDVSLAGVDPSHVYDVETQTVLTIGDVVIEGPWSDTGYDYPT